MKLSLRVLDFAILSSCVFVCQVPPSSRQPVLLCFRHGCVLQYVACLRRHLQRTRVVICDVRRRAGGSARYGRAGMECGRVEVGGSDVTSIHNHCFPSRHCFQERERGPPAGADRRPTAKSFAHHNIGRLVDQ